MGTPTIFRFYREAWDWEADRLQQDVRMFIDIESKEAEQFLVSIYRRAWPNFGHGAEAEIAASYRMSIRGAISENQGIGGRLVGKPSVFFDAHGPYFDLRIYDGCIQINTDGVN